MRILIASLILLLASPLCLAQSYLRQTVIVSKDAKPMGVAEVLSPVELISVNGDKAVVKISGVVADSYRAVLQRSISNSEVFVRFDTENPTNFTQLKQIEDDYGEVWFESEGVYEVDKSAVTDDAEPLYAKAKELYEITCSACHRLHEPQSFTANQWPASIQGMISANYVTLEESDLALITKYLQHNSRNQ